jgi:serine/threonine-protein kinase
MHKKLGREVPIDYATFIASRIARGLKVAHEKVNEEGNSQNIVHRDLGGNIIITNEGEVRIMDFGIAKAESEKDEFSGIAGKVPFMSPEQLTGEVDQRMDLWALGVIYFELLAGKHPFLRGEGDTVPIVAGRILSNQREPIRTYREVPRGVEAIVDRAMEPNIHGRFQTARGMLRALEGLMYEQGEFGSFGPTTEKLGRHIKDLIKESKKLK